MSRAITMKEVEATRLPAALSGLAAEGRTVMSTQTQDSRLAARFWAKVDKDGPVPEFAPHLGACWLWTAGGNDIGYGQFTLDGRRSYAHRVVLLLADIEIPKGLEVDHLCRVRRCVNPSHLELVTHAENCQRRLPNGQTHCAQGHEYTPENTSYFGAFRRCKTCRRLEQQHRRAQKVADA